jgi:hypothetical protein
VSVTTAARNLLPVSHIGFAIAVITGLALLSAQATVVAGTGAAPWKLGLLILACVNVVVFHYGIYRRVNEWTDAAVTPVAARVGAGVSLIAWTGVIFAGRLLAYTYDLVEVIEVHLHLLFLRFPAAVSCRVSQLVPSGDFLSCHGASFLE